MPERDAPRLLATAYREAKQAAIAGLGVGKFGRRRPFPVDRLGLLPAYAPAPGGQFRRILRQGQMAIAPGLARPGYRYAGGHAGLCQGDQVIVFGEAAVGQMLALQLGQNKGRLMVGSANLTDAGLVGNLETVSTIVVSEEDLSAAPLLAEALRYFEVHADKNDRAMRDVLSRARGRTPWLANVEPTVEVTIRGERVAFLTESVSAGVAERFRNFVGDDAIDRLIVVSLYADGTLEGFSRLRAEFGMPATSFVVDPHEHDFTAETFRAQADASLHSSEPHDRGGKRPLHAKMLIVCGARADYVFAGSANTSMLGLYSRFGGAGNAEAGIARTEPAGTAIDRLKLSDCLSSPMPLSALSLRRSARAGAEVERMVSPDGGDCWIEHGIVFWRPPAGCVPADSLLHLTDGSGAEIAVTSPVTEGNRWSLSHNADAEAPRSAALS